MADAIIDLVGPDELTLICTLYNQIFRPPRQEDALRRRFGAELLTHIDHLTGQAPERLACYAPPDRFEAVRGRADLPWQTDDLMKLLRADD